MKLQRTIAPTAPPLDWEDLWQGLIGSIKREPAIRRFEDELKAYYEVDHVFLVSSGKAALALILRALQSLSARKEVLIPAYTCFSVPSAILKARLKVALCDIDISTFDFDHQLLKESVSDQTLCVIPSHLFGIPSDMDRIKSVCEQRKVFVVEDAAQAMGGIYKGRKIGTIGDVGFFSLGRGKNITCGSGGIIITRSASIAEAISQIYAELPYPGLIQTFKEYGELVAMRILINPTLYWLPSSLPFLQLGATFFHEDFLMQRLSSMKAAVLWNWRKHLFVSNLSRRDTATYFYTQLGRSHAIWEQLPYLRFPVILHSRKERDAMLLMSRQKGIGINTMYPTPISEIPQIRAFFDNREYPRAKQAADTLLTVPTHMLLSDTDRENLASLLHSMCEASPANSQVQSECSYAIASIVK